MRLLFAFAIMLLLSLSLQACGRKGALVLPPVKPDVQIAPADAQEKRP